MYRELSEAKAAEALANLEALAKYLGDLDRALLWETREAYSLVSLAFAQAAQSRVAQVQAVVVSLERIIASISASAPHPDYERELQETLRFISPLSASLRRQMSD